MGFENKTGRQLRSLIKKSGELELSLVKVAIPSRRRGHRARRGHADQSLGLGTSPGRSRHKDGQIVGHQRRSSDYSDRAGISDESYGRAS